MLMAMSRGEQFADNIKMDAARELLAAKGINDAKGLAIAFYTSHKRERALTRCAQR
jgi:hypothetical protein